MAASGKPSTTSRALEAAGDAEAARDIGALDSAASGADRKLVGLASEEAVPIRAHAPIVDGEGKQVGEVTSGTISPTLGHPVMLAYLPADLAKSDAPLWAQVRGKRLPVARKALPFVPKRYKR